MTTRAEQLIELAEVEFGQINEAEKRFFQAVANGEAADYNVNSIELDKPDNADKWEDDRTLKSDRLIWLCTELKAKQLLTLRGVILLGVKVHGELNLEFARVDFPLVFCKCVFTEPILLKQAKILNLELDGSHVPSLEAVLIRIEGNLFLRKGFKSEGKLNLSGSIIGGNLSCEEGKFINLQGDALCAEGLDIKGSVFLRKGFQARGMVNLLGATIGGDLDCEGGKFDNLQGDALKAGSIGVKGSVFLRKGFQARGMVNLLGATIGGDLDCQNGKFAGQERVSLLLECAKVSGNVLLRRNPQTSSSSGEGFQSEGQVRLYGATVGGNLDCRGGKFVNPKGSAIDATGINIKGAVLMCNEFQAEGLVRLYRATIGGNLECHGGKFVNPKEDEDALNAEGIDVKGGIFFIDGFLAEGGVRLYGATISSSLDCHGGKFDNPKGAAIDATGVDIKGTVFLSDGFQAKGMVNLLGANIGSDLECRGGKFVNLQGDALIAEDIDVKGAVYLSDGFHAEGVVNLRRARIDSTLSMRGIANPEKMELDLRFARIHILEDNEKSWPQKTKIHLNDCVYDTISHDSPLDDKKRLEWLRLQKLETDFSPQPYEQLAKVLRSLGHEDAAIKVLIGKQENRRSYGKMGMLGSLWNWILGLTIDHGYKPHKALYFALIPVILGYFLFGHAYSQGLLSTSKFEAVKSTSASNTETTKEYPEFNAFIYSLDLFLPIVDLRQKNYWQPNAKSVDQTLTPMLKIQWGRVVQYYFWAHILLGWFLSTLWVAGFTGLVRRLN
jgi:hypothetical protein